VLGVSLQLAKLLPSVAVLEPAGALAEEYSRD